MKKAGLNKYVYELNVDISSKVHTTEIMPNIHEYFMLKYGIK